MKKAFALILALMFVLASLSACGTGSSSSGNGETSGEMPSSGDGELRYQLNADGQSYTVTGIGTYTKSDIVISTYKDLPVTAIDAYAFKGKGITSVTLGDTVKVIGSCAFEGCTALETVTLGSGIVEFCNRAFADCTGLTDVYYGGTLESWCHISITTPNANPCFFAKKLHIKDESGAYALLTSLVIPDSVTELMPYAFCGLSCITGVTFPTDFTCIGEGAFYNCTGLTGITVPASVTAIEKSAFSGCTSLTDAEFANVKNWFYSANKKAIGSRITESSLADNGTAAALLTSDHKNDYLTVYEGQ